MNFNEMLAHVPLAYLPEAKRAAVLGDGMGALTAYLLQYPLDSVTLVDRNVKTFRSIAYRYAPKLYEGLVDPRVTTAAYMPHEWVAEQWDDRSNYGVCRVCGRVGQKRVLQAADPDFEICEKLGKAKAIFFGWFGCLGCL